METVLFVVGGIGFIVCLVLLIVSAARKRPVRNVLIGLGVCLAVFVAGAMTTPADPPGADKPKVDAVQAKKEACEQLKQEAIEADFVKVNGGEVAKDTKLTTKGKVDVVMDEKGEQFMLSTKEGDGCGIYYVAFIDAFPDMEKDNISVAKGDTVEIWGSYYGKDKNTGIPIITALIIEK